MHHSFRSEVRVLTRGHQITNFLSVLILAPSIFTGVMFFSMKYGWAGGLPMTGVALLFGFLFYYFFPRKDEVTIAEDQLVFKHRPPVAFADIASYDTDDYLTLVLRNGPPLLFHHSNKDYREFCQHLRKTLASWQPEKSSGLQRPKRKLFYGSFKARIIGFMIAAVSTGGIIVAMQLPRMPGSTAILLGTGIPFGLMMLLGKRPNSRK